MRPSPSLSVSALPAPFCPLLRRGQGPISRNVGRIAHLESGQRRYHDAARALLLISGSMLSLAGAVVAAGGYLSSLNGSPFYMLIGLALIGCGILVAKANRAGAWLCLGVFAGTLSWSLGHAHNGASLVSRLVGPCALLAIVALLMPVLCGWRPRQAVIAFSMILTATVAFGTTSLNGGPISSTAFTVAQFLDAQTKGFLQ